MRDGFHVMALVLALAGCSRDPAQDPDAQQLARMNKEITVLSAEVKALSSRLDRLEKAPGRAALEALQGMPLPIEAGPGAPDDDQPPIILAVSDVYTLDGKVVAEAELAARLGEHAKAGKNARLVIQAAPDIPQARVVRAMDLARQSGLQHIALSLVPTPPAKTP